MEKENNEDDTSSINNEDIEAPEVDYPEKVDSEFLKIYYLKLVDRVTATCDRNWAQTTYFTTIIISLLTIPIIAYFHYASEISEDPSSIRLLILFPTIGIIISVIAILCNSKQFDNLYTTVGVMSKIEAYFGLNKECPTGTLHKDKHLISDKWATIKYKDKKYASFGIEEFAKENLMRPGTIGFYILAIYIALCIFATLQIIFFIQFLYSL